MPGVPLTLSEVRRATVAALSANRLTCCLVGGAACAEYGMVNRTPNDVDMLVVTSSLDSESIKLRIVATNSMFFLVPAKNPMNTYKVLWYSLSYPKISRYDRPRACKVDILTPGVLTIPRVPRDKIVHSGLGAVPVAPFMLVLLLKLRAWEDHRDAVQLHYRAKQPMDEQDILEMLGIGERMGEKLGGTGTGVAADPGEEWMPSSLIQESRRRAREFVLEVGGQSRRMWKLVGVY